MKTTTLRFMLLHAKPYIFFRTFKYPINSFRWGCKSVLSSQQTVHKYTVSPVEEGNKKYLFSHFVSLCCPRHLIWCVIENQGSALSAQQTKGSLEYPRWVSMQLAAGEAGRLVMSHVLIATVLWESYRSISGSACSRHGGKYRLHGACCCRWRRWWTSHHPLLPFTCNQVSKISLQLQEYVH